MYRDRRLFRLHRNVYRSVALVLFFVAFGILMWSNSSSQPYDYNSIWKLKGYKTILAYELPAWFKLENGPEVFMDLKCPVQKCRLTTNHAERRTADLVLFHEHYIKTYYERPANQIYALYNIESPPHTARILYPDIINWTISYRYDSTIPAPYRIWKYYNPNITQKTQNRNYASGKTKMVAWFVSNCNDDNGRLNYARELQKHIQVDIYGKCGDLECSRDTTKKCYEMLDKDYKFYLAFENSNCVDYITEKLFENAFDNSVLPIVMGARPEDYKKYAPNHSYIHVEEFSSPKELAEYLDEVDQSDQLYNSYFQWRDTGHVEWTPKKYFCDLCSMLHDNDTMSTPKWYADYDGWWNAPGVCTKGRWSDGNATNKASNRSGQNSYLCIIFIIYVNLIKIVG